MARTLIDIPEGKLEQAMAALGTSTKRATVIEALDAVIARSAHEELVAWIAAGGLPDLSDGEVMDRAAR